MPITKETTNYAGRKKDLLILKGAKGTVAEIQVVSVEFGKVSQFVAGIQKLVQRHLILLTTQLGSQVNFSDFGSPLFSTITAGMGSRNKTELIHQFNFANMKVLTDLKEYQATRTDLLPDESIASAKLKDIVYDGSSLNFSIQLQTTSNTGIEFVVPLPIIDN